MSDLSELSCREIQQRYREGGLELQSEAVKDCAESIKAENPAMDKETAFAICQSMENEGELSEAEINELEDPCWDGYVAVGTKEEDGRTVPNCVPEEDAPDDAGLENARLSGRVLQHRRLETAPIEREERSDSEVVYRNLKLLDEGVWTDQASKTPTLYDETTMQNTDPVYEGEGPPVNIMHDLSPEGEPNDASVGGHVDPNSLEASDGALFGDVVLDTSTAAGEFADENLQSALESNGRVGFGGPSVELMPTEMAEADHPEAEEHVTKAELTGLGLVMEPASKTVDFANETRTRQVALGDSDKGLSVQTRHMATINDLRGDLEQYNIDTEDMTDEDVVEFAKGLHSDLMEDLEAMEEVEMEDGGDMEDDEEEDDMEDEDADMGEYEMGDMEDLMMEVEELRERISDMEAEFGSMMSAGEVESELSEATDELKQELAEADTVEELDKRLSNLESEPEEPRTMADSGSEGKDEWREWATAEGTPNTDSNRL